jgi:hypothetical protein
LFPTSFDSISFPLTESIIPNILLDAILAFPRSGPNYYDYPASSDPNIIANITMNTFSAKFISGRAGGIGVLNFTLNLAPA